MVIIYNLSAFLSIFQTKYFPRLGRCYSFMLLQNLKLSSVCRVNSTFIWHWKMFNWLAWVQNGYDTGWGFLDMANVGNYLVRKIEENQADCELWKLLTFSFYALRPVTYSELLIESLKPDLSENPWIRSDLKISKEKVGEPQSFLPIPIIIIGLVSPRADLRNINS